MSHHVYLSLGSNLGDRLSYLKQAIEGLSALAETSIRAISPVYETAAWGKKDQADFLNLCLHLETKFSPEDLLEQTQTLELRLGRERHEHWGPRTIDIDLLLYDQEIMETERLTLPHPYMDQRAFVLIPLADIATDLRHPVLSKTIAELLSQMDQSQVWLFENSVRL